MEARFNGRSRGGRKGDTRQQGGTLVHRDGHRVTFLGRGADEGGDYLRIEHVWTRPGMMAGPHWHPILSERFVVKEGRMRFRLDGREEVLSAGETVTIPPPQVHRFWNVGEGRLVVDHEVRPPGQHREMFELWHRLDAEGKTNGHGVPTNPLWLALLWERQDGYVAGVPALVQQVVFGGLARAARLLGFRGQVDLSPKANRAQGDSESDAWMRPLRS